MTNELVIKVAGEPIPQGSMKGFRRGRHVAITHNNEKTLKPWRARIATEAQAVRPDDWVMQGAFELDVDFVLPRPKNRMTKKAIALYDALEGVEPHIIAPDCDKLIRAVDDGLTGILFEDDKQVYHIEASKVYASPYPTGDKPGVTIIVRRV